MATTRRNLSGIYYRSKNQETGKFENICFEELPEDEQDKILDSHDKPALQRLAKVLATTLIDVAEAGDVINASFEEE